MSLSRSLWSTKEILKNITVYNLFSYEHLLIASKDKDLSITLYFESRDWQSNESVKIYYYNFLYKIDIKLVGTWNAVSILIFKLILIYTLETIGINITKKNILIDITY